MKRDSASGRAAPVARGAALIAVLALGGAVVVGLLLALLPLVGVPPEEFPFGGMLQMGLQVLVPLFAGAWLGVAVRCPGLRLVLQADVGGEVRAVRRISLHWGLCNRHSAPGRSYS